MSLAPGCWLRHFCIKSFLCLHVRSWCQDMGWHAKTSLARVEPYVYQMIPQQNTRHMMPYPTISYQTKAFCKTLSCISTLICRSPCWCAWDLGMCNVGNSHHRHVSCVMAFYQTLHACMSARLYVKMGRRRLLAAEADYLLVSRCVSLLHSAYQGPQWKQCGIPRDTMVCNAYQGSQ